MIFIVVYICIIFADIEIIDSSTTPQVSDFMAGKYCPHLYHKIK